MARHGMVIDLNKCTGCRACMEACKVENNTPQAIFWTYVFRFEEGEFPDTRISFMPRPCMHCDSAPCVKVCPTGARYKRDDGLVATDVDKCLASPPSLWSPALPPGMTGPPCWSHPPPP